MRLICATMDSMNTVRVNAYAKLNLTLDITGEADGYHLLDSLVVTVGLCDRMILRRRKDGLVRVFMHGMGCETLPPEKNNAFRAGEAFIQRFQTTGADVTVYKNIPVGAGMGGSSADAAGVLNGLARLYGIEDGAALKELADGLGSDTGYLLSGGLARMRGRGELLECLPVQPELHFLVLAPKRGVNTAQCFRAYDEAGKQFPPRTERALGDILAGNAEWAARLFGNALYDAAKSLNEQVEEAYLALRGFSPLGVSLTGSGSACFAVFPTRELCEWAKSRYRGNARAYVLKTVYPKQL